MAVPPRTLKSEPALRSAPVPGLYVAKIKIHLKPGVSDPEGNNIVKALHLLGFASVKNVTTERIIQLHVDAAAREDALAEAEKACRRLLTNPIIHDYRIDVEESR